MPRDGGEGCERPGFTPGREVHRSIERVALERTGTKSHRWAHAAACPESQAELREERRISPRVVATRMR